MSTMEKTAGANADKIMRASPGMPAPLLTGSETQVEWAERIRAGVRTEFERVEKSFQSVADRQDGASRIRTEAILVILRDKRDAVMNRSEAGYFIREWQDISDQVRQAIGSDPRFKALRARVQAESE
jgi:hypothetical protein